MVIYEVNLKINKEIFTKYKTWLDGHIQQMLRIPGFLQATLLQEILDDEYQTPAQKNITVQYLLRNSADLKTYFDKYASSMRDDGINRFKNNFSATRRIFEVEKMF
tara:strand:+ start:185 stop:502 length:318 start_codon:yes stop_codon:yes gene_type:complete